MKLINQSAEFLPQEAGLSGIYKAIELAGRTSYLSWDKMTDDSAKKFVKMLIKSKHTSVLEHGTVYLKMYSPGIFEKIQPHNVCDYLHNPYCRYKELLTPDGLYKFAMTYYITTNLRVLQENGWLDDLKYLCKPTEFHEKRLSVRVVTDIGVTREFNRHRTFSVVEQSTRYCNFSKDKFGNEITFIIPDWLDIKEGEYLRDWTIENTQIDSYLKHVAFMETCCNVESFYKNMINKGYTPQQARQILPLSTKTEVVYTAFESDWRHFFDLRLFGKTGEPHPQMKQLAELIKQEFEKAGVWEEIMKYPSKYD